MAIKHFDFYECTLNSINALPEDLRLKFYEAAVNYGLYGTEPDFDGLEKALWFSMQDAMDFCSMAIG